MRRVQAYRPLPNPSRFSDSVHSLSCNSQFRIIEECLNNPSFPRKRESRLLFQWMPAFAGACENQPQEAREHRRECAYGRQRPRLQIGFGTSACSGLIRGQAHRRSRCKGSNDVASGHKPMPALSRPAFMLITVCLAALRNPPDSANLPRSTAGDRRDQSMCGP